MDSARIVFKCADKDLRPTIAFHFVAGEKLAVRPSPFTARKDAVFVEYAARKDWVKANGPVPQDVFANVAMRFDPLGIDYYCRPNPEYYDVPIPKPVRKGWEDRFPDAPGTTFTLEARAAGEDVELYLNGHYAGRRAGAKGVRQVVLSGIAPKGGLESGDDFTLEETGPDFRIEWFKGAPPSAFVTLGSRGAHNVGVLAKAKPVLSLKPGVQQVGGVTMDVFPAEASIDPSLHRTTRHQGDLFYSPYFSRVGYNTSPEFSQWVVPNAFYTHAYVLCADVPQEGKEPYVGTQITRFCDIGAQALMSGRTDLGAADADVKEVGTLEWTEKGRRCKTPLKLVKVRLNIGGIIDLVNDKPVYADSIRSTGRHKLGRPLPKVGDYLDFEFNGSSEWKKASSVQIFGVTLQRSPFGVEFVQSEFGNIFYGDEKPETGVEVTALEEGASGTVAYSIFDVDFRVIKRGELPFALGKKGERKVLTLDLDMKANGWYGLDFAFRNAAGETLFEHEGAFALLGPDVREAGYDSPFAAWPHNGRHNSQPDPKLIAEKMYKAGFRKSWEPPGNSEAELAPWKITRSLIANGKAPSICSAEKLAESISNEVAEARKILELWPHASHCIQLLHESGGRELAQEMLYKPAVRGEYKGIEGDWTTYYCTEFSKAMRAAFPGYAIMIGNGSSASERIASLCRAGFDLDLVDQLGIESKGFGTMPELNANHEAPGMLWALRETGRRFGYTNFTMNACNEYVFRPERTIPRTADRFGRMWVTDYYLRDYLISLAHGVLCISVGHLEDSKTNYYNTNWGAGPLCKCYPYAYPKRAFVAIAVLTRVLDCIERSPRRLATGESATYALEWTRNRKVRDWAAAFWTPAFPAKVKVTYPAGTKVTHTSTFGVDTVLAPAADGSVTIDVGSSPVYLVASARATGAEVVAHEPGDGTGYQMLAAISTATVEAAPLAEKPNSYPAIGRFAHADVADPTHGTCLSAMLEKRAQPLPEVVWEYEHLRFRKPVALDGRATDRLGLWVKGNGSFAGLNVELADATNPKTKFTVGFDGRTTRSLLCWHGWRFVTAKLPQKARACAKLVVDHVMVGSAACALDPREMVPVTDPVVLGPLMVRAAEGATATVTLSAEEAAALVASATVSDRDLAGKQPAVVEAPAEKKPGPKGAAVAKASEEEAPAFESDLKKFLATENRKPGFTAELQRRVHAAYRHAPETCYKAKNGTLETSDPLLAVTMLWLGPGLPKPVASKAVKLDPAFAKAEKLVGFARELTSAMPDFGLARQFPDGVMACMKTGAGGKASLVLLNFTDKPQRGNFSLPSDSYKNGLVFCNLMTDDFVKAGRLSFPWSLKPRGFTVLRLNSGPMMELDDADPLGLLPED